MSKWDDDKPEVRKAATYKFCQMLDQNVDLRKACQEDRDVAWNTLRKAGEFEDMPHAVAVHVFELTIDSNDKVVTMIIPKQDDVDPPGAFDPKLVWRCSWCDAKNMTKWKENDSPAERDTATYEFCKMLDKDPDLRKACKEERDMAWDTLRKAGEFDDMPHGVEIHVFEKNINSNDGMVTLILPEPGDIKPFDTFIPGEVWRCTWAHYIEVAMNELSRQSTPRR
jgi:hypothetical protein